MQSRLEEEEEAKAALMSRIQRLTKLILVSSKNAIPDLADTSSDQRSISVEDNVSCVFVDFFFLGIAFGCCILLSSYYNSCTL